MKNAKNLTVALILLMVMAVPAFANGGGTAKLQIIHNAADPAAEMVDIWVNGEPFRTDFAFRTATDFLTVPAGVTLNVGVAPAGSSSIDDILATFPVKLRKNRKYVAIANGVLDPSQFDSSANAEKIGFNIFQKTARSRTWLPNRVALMAFHGATDAPRVDIKVRGSEGRSLFNNLSYGKFSSYRSVTAREYILEVTPADNNAQVLAAYTADLTGLGGNAAVVFASGFLNPDNNQNGAAFGLFAALPSGDVVELPAAEILPSLARLQIIHNAADPAAELVDIWVNGEPFRTNFAFRSATEFLDVPAGVELNVGVAPAGSSSTDDIIANFPFTLEANKTYVAIANGVLGSDFENNPDGLNIEFNIFARDGIRDKAKWGHLVNLIAFHGATDAPTIDVLTRIGKWDWTFFNDLSYGEFSNYRNFLPTRMVLEITPGYDNNTTVAKFDVDLRGLAGGAAVVFASGFLTPGDDNDGPAFGLFAALPDGNVVEFPQILPQQFARLQVIHNAAGSAADMVDIWVNGEKYKDNFAFRTATAFETVPAGVELTIGVAGADSDDPSDILATFPVTLEANKNYVAFANGVLGENFADNPDGRSTAFTLFLTDQARLIANDPGKVEFFALHGATDAPTVDVIARDVATLVDDAAYGDITGYVPVPAGSYILDVTPGTDNETIVASFEANLSGLTGGTAAVFASGFLSPGDNNGGPAFGLFAALADGTVVEFPAVVPMPMAKLQVIHNAADPAAEVVDIWVNGAKYKDNFAFRTATAFEEVPAGVELTIGVAGADSDDPSDILATFPVTLEENVNYVAVANGVLGSNFQDNPDGRSIGFTLLLKDSLQTSATTAGTVDFVVVHGATDAPTVDVIARDVATLVNDAAYGDITDYISVPAGAYTLDVTPGDDTATVVASFVADLSGLGGGSAVVFASGFLTPEDDDGDDAPSFGIFAALADGTVAEFPAVTRSDRAAAAASLSGDDLLPTEFGLSQNYPNPFNPSTIITFALPTNADARLVVYNLLGQEVETLIDNNLAAGEYEVEFNASSVASGVYFYRLTADTFTETRKMVLLK